MRGGGGHRLLRSVVDGSLRVVRGVFAAALAAALLHPAAAVAQSSGCSAVNAGLLDFHAVLVSNDANQPGTTSGVHNTSGALSMMRTTTSYTDNIAGSTGFVPDAATTYSFTTGDRLEFTANVSAISVLDPARIRFRAGLSTGNGAFQPVPARADATATGTFTGFYVIPSGLRAIGMSVDSPNGSHVTASVSVICIPFAAPTPTLAVSMTHTGTPAQGGTVDYTIVPSVTGAATSGALTLAFTLPSGLSYAAGTGTGWNCTSASCTYGTTIATGASGNPLTLRANVAATAATGLAPSVSLTGGGASIAATATNPTTIAQVAASVTIAGGDTQTATVGTAFATPLSVTVRDAANVAIPDASVTFTAPASGASGTFANASTTVLVNASGAGVASSGTFTANAIAGAYAVSATAGAASATFALTNTAATAVPTVTGITPASGPLTGGGSVVITGTALTGATDVHFGSTPANRFTVDSATQITATAPAASAGVVDVTVTTPGGTSATNVATRFTYAQSPATPTITATPPALSNSASATFQFTLATGTAECAIDTGSFAACVSPVSFNGLADGPHVFQVRASNNGLTSSPASHSWSIDTTPPAAPVVGTPATGSSRVVTLRSVAGTAEAATTVTIYLDGTADGTATSAGSGQWTYTLASLTPGAHTVTARSTDAAGNASAESATRSFTAVAVLTATQAVSSVAATTNVALTAVQPVTTSGGLAPVGYALSGGTLPDGLAFDTTTGRLSGTPTVPLAAATFTVTATDALSQTASQTFSLSVATASQTITFTSTAPSAAIVGGASYTPAATATSGLPVAFTIDPSSSAICTLSGGHVSFTAAGTCRVNADQSGNAAYAAAAQMSQSFAVGAASQTIGFTSTAPVGAVVGGATYTPTATATSGLPIAFTIDVSSSAVCAIGAGVVRFTGTGTCRIDADQPGNAGYAAAPQVQQSFAVGAASQTISFTTLAPGNAKVGGTPYSPSAIATSGLPVTLTIDPTSSAVCALSGGSVRFQGSGTCLIDADQGGNAGYAAALQVRQSITVGKGDQTISFAGLSGASLSASPLMLSATAGSGLTVPFSSETTGVCTVAGTTLMLVAQGTCTIAADQPGDTNWNAAPTVRRSFTVLPATLSLTPGHGTAAVVGASFSQANTVTGGVAPYHFSLASGTLPEGTSLDSATGTVNGTLTHAGAFSYTVSVTDSASPPMTVSGGGVAGGTVAKGSQTLGFTSTPPSPAVVGGTYTVVALSSASLTPAYAIAPAGAGVCTLAGATVTFAAPGNCLIYADQPGTRDYDAAPQISQTVTVLAAPTAADRTETVPYASTGTTIDLGSSIGGGGHTGIAIVSPPGHGTASLAGDRVTYTPATGYFGSDSFTYSATGPGGTSSPATVRVTVATPAAPGSAGGTLDVGYDSTGQAIPLQPSGVYTGLVIATAPTKGSVTISGTTATYVPTHGSYGADSFSYTATGPGGTSAPATISVTIALPAAPGATGSTAAVAYDSTGQAIPLQPSGVYTGLAIATAPTKGSVTISGTTATYVPTHGSYGADSFSYTATGPGGTSAPATISVTIALPAAPSATGSTAAVAYDSTGQAIPLQPSGVFTGVALATPPTKGTVTIAGTTATYVPTPGSYGADSFTYIATGPGGTSTPATVSVTIETPAAPGTAAIAAAVAYGSTGQAIALQPSGVFASVALATAPTKGSVTITGTTARYVPAAGSYGADSFTYTATGPGGTSAPATVSVTIATPPPPTAAPVNVAASGTTVEGGASVGIDLARLVSGTFATIEIATPPTHGSVTLRAPPAAAVSTARATGDVGILAVADWTAVYTPQAGFAGTDSFQFVAVGPGGRSPPATVAITVTGQAPTVQAKTASIGDAQTVSIDLSEGAIGAPFTAATIDSITPVDAATGRIVQGGSAAQPSYRLDLTTRAHYGGTVIVRYRLGNAFGLSAPAAVTVTVTARPDPSADPVVRAIADAQAETARRFARTQVSNFMTRAQQLHHGGGATNPLGIAVTLRDAVLSPRGTNLSAQDPTITPADRNRFLSRTEADAALPGRPIGRARSEDRSADPGAAASRPRAEASTVGPRAIGSVAVWTGGSIEIGTLDRQSARAKITLASGGLSSGADLRITDCATLGLGGGYGSDVSRIGGEAARVRSETKVFAAYGSFAPIDGAFVDVMIGHGSLDYATRRAVAATGEVALGRRDGTMTFGAASAGLDRADDRLRWSTYGRLEWLDGTLDSYAETGATRYALRFDARHVRSLTGVVGGRFEMTQDLGFAAISPRIAAEWLHEFEAAGVQALDYADFTGASTYRIRGIGWQREQYQLTIGSRLRLMTQWMIDTEIGLRGASGERAAQARLRISKQF